MQQLNPKEQAVLNKISGDKDLANYFFARVSDAKWFYPLKDKGFFESKKNPQPVETKDKGFFVIPRWNVLDYLEKISQECREPQNEKYAKELIQIIRKITNYRDENEQKVNNYRTWWVFTKILINLPSAIITLDDIDLISVWVDSKYDKPFVTDIGQKLLPKFLEGDNQEDHKKALMIIEIINSREFAVREGMDSYYLEKIYSNKNCRLLGKRCGDISTKSLIEKLTNIIPKEEKDNYSYIWRSAIENHKKDIPHNEPKDIYLSALRDVLISYLPSESDSSEKKQEFLKKLLNHDLNIIKRVAIFAINKNWDQYKNLFWGFIKKEHFRESNLRHEIYMLFQENFKLFEEKEKQRIISFIEDCAKIILQEETEETDKEKQRYTAYWMQSWLSAMVSQGDQKLDDLYNKCKETTQTDPEYPEFASYTYSRTGSKSPLTIEELLGKAVPDIVLYLNEFTSQDGWDNPTEDGLAWVLRQAVKENSGKFATKLNEFLNVKLLYIAHMLSAFEELWRNKKIINWKKIIEFCQRIVNKEEFWRDESSYHNWIVSAIAGLIEEGTRNDEWAFDPIHFPLAEQILLKLNKNQASQMNERKEIKDAVNTALNTAKGHIVRALVNYALRVARVEKESGTDKEVKWSDSVKNEFDKELGKSSEERSLEFSTFMGVYLPQLYFLDESWVIENIKRVFPNDHSAHWNVAMQGYFLASKAYPHLYTLLREKSHYEEAINKKFEDREIREKLVQHICLGYLWGIEALEGGESLFYRLLTEWASSEIQEIIHFFWMQRDAAVIEKEIFNRVLDFWRYCYEILKDHEKQGELTSGNKRIASDLSLLTAFLTDISEENKKWLLLIAPHAGENHQTTFFIEYLNKLADKNPGAVGEIFWEIIKDLQRPPDFREEDISEIVKKLYLAGKENQANTICNHYARKYAGQKNFLLRACSKNKL